MGDYSYAEFKALHAGRYTPLQTVPLSAHTSGRRYIVQIRIGDVRWQDADNTDTLGAAERRRAEIRRVQPHVQVRILEPA